MLLMPSLLHFPIQYVTMPSSLFPFMFQTRLISEEIEKIIVCSLPAPGNATVATPKEGSMPHKLQANKEEISREASMNEKEIQ